MRPAFFSFRELTKSAISIRIESLPSIRILYRYIPSPRRLRAMWVWLVSLHSRSLKTPNFTHCCPKSAKKMFRKVLVLMPHRALSLVSALVSTETRSPHPIYVHLRGTQVGSLADFGESKVVTASRSYNKERSAFWISPRLTGDQDWLEVEANPR